MEAFLLVSGGIWSACNRDRFVPSGSFLLTSEFKHFLSMSNCGNANWGCSWKGVMKTVKVTLGCDGSRKEHPVLQAAQ